MCHICIDFLDPKHLLKSGFQFLELEGMILGVILNPKNILLKSIEVFISYIYLVDGGRDGSEAINISGQS